MEGCRAGVSRACALGTMALLLSTAFGGCKVSADAAAASEQMTATAAELERYYGALVDEQADTIALLEVDGAISGVAFGAEDRKEPEATKAELVKRERMAEALAKLATSMEALTKSKAPTEMATAATALGNALIDAKALPTGSAVPDDIGKAGKFLLEVVQQHEERKAAQAIDRTLAAVAELFGKEKPAYDSIARFHLRQAAAVSKDLIAAKGVDVAPMLEPALKPFDLLPLPVGPAMQGKLLQLSQDRLQARVEEGTRRETEASDAMLTALKEMSTRVHTLATERRLEVRGNPFSLGVVEGWIDGLN